MERWSVGLTMGRIMGGAIPAVSLPGATCVEAGGEGGSLAHDGPSGDSILTFDPEEFARRSRRQMGVTSCIEGRAMNKRETTWLSHFLSSRRSLLFRPKGPGCTARQSSMPSFSSSLCKDGSHEEKALRRYPIRPGYCPGWLRGTVWICVYVCVLISILGRGVGLNYASSSDGLMGRKHTSKHRRERRGGRHRLNLVWAVGDLLLPP